MRTCQLPITCVVLGCAAFLHAWCVNEQSVVAAAVDLSCCEQRDDAACSACHAGYQPAPSCVAIGLVCLLAGDFIVAQVAPMSLHSVT